MTTTYESIMSTTSNNSTNVALTNIPSTYTDLVLVISGANSGSGTKFIEFNGDTNSSNYQVSTILGLGISYLYAGQYNNSSWIDVGNAGSYPYVTLVQINSYSNSSIKKRYISRHGAAQASVEFLCGGWSSTAAINQINIKISGNNMGSTQFSLYGIKEE